MRRKGTSNSSRKMVKARRDSVTNIHVWSYKRCGELRTETREGDCATYLNLSGLKRAKENLLEDPSGEKSANETEIGEDLDGGE